MTQTVLDVVHRSANVVAARILLAKMHGQGSLAELGGHADDCNGPHPEQRARTAKEQRGSDPGNIARAHRGRQRRHQRVEGADIALGGALASAPEHFEAEAQLALRQQLQAQGQIQAGAGQQGQHCRAPDNAVDGTDMRNECIH